MRDNVIKYLLLGDTKKYYQAISEGKSQSELEANNIVKPIFGDYADASVVAERIFQSYSRMVREVTEGDVTYKVFFSDERDQRLGYLSNIYGNTGVLSLINRMKYKYTDDDLEMLKNNFYYIMDYVEKNGYTLYPYLSEEENVVPVTDKGYSKNFFDKQNYPYVGAMTWALSYFVSIRRAISNGLIDIESTYSDKIVKQIRTIIEWFNKSVILDENNSPIGWGFTPGCKTPSLFFTYSVLEAYSDFEDNVVAVMDDEDDDDDDMVKTSKDIDLLDKINSNFSGDGIHIVWRDNCYRIADNVWENYKKVMKDNFVDDTFPTGYKVITRDDILKSNSSNALFNSLFLVFILFYGYVNVRHSEEDVLLTMTSALQNVQRTYEQLRKESLEYLVDSYIIPFKSMHDRNQDIYIKYLNSKSLMDATLIPTLVKANNLIAYHIQRYPVQQMGLFFIEMFDNAAANDWIWEAGQYDVKITERYIESIADFYQYYNVYERPFLKKAATNAAERQAREERANKLAQKKADEKIELRVSEKLSEEKVRISAEYTIENAITEKVGVLCKKIIIEALQNIAGNMRDSTNELDEFESQLRDGLLDILISAILAPVSNGEIGDIGQEVVQKLPKRVKQDWNLFLISWLEKLSKAPADAKISPQVIATILNDIGKEEV